MENVFGDVEKDVLYEAIQECAIDFAKCVGKDDQEEDVILINNFIECTTRFELVETIVDKLRAKGYQISERT
jgi:hypothetical protein